MKFGTIAIVGKPNVGKSTLINSIFNETKVFSSNKPQTTRDLIEITFLNKDLFINFLDTPGLHKPKNNFDHFLNGAVKKALKKSDLVLFLIDPTRRISEEDYNCIKVLKSYKCEKVVLVVNKAEMVSSKKISELYDAFIDTEFKFVEKIAISAINQTGIKPIFDIANKYLDTYPGDVEELETQKKDVSEVFSVKEIIREVLFKHLLLEIGYGSAVLIDRFDYEENENTLYVDFVIVVEKESQKSIVIGKNGTMIKKINLDIRNKLKKIYACKIFTQSFVKVKKNWRKNDAWIKELGYKLN